MTSTGDKIIDTAVGKIMLKPNNRAKYLRIKVHPEKGVVVSVPKLCSEKRALAFVDEKKDWINKALNKTRKIKTRNTVFTHQTIFKTYSHQLELQTHVRQSLKFDLIDDTLRVFYPDTVEVKHERVQEFIRHAIVQTLRYEAKQVLPVLTREYAAIHNYPVQEIKVRNNKTRWGSCSGKNNINLNIHLMRLPKPLIEYVVLHELVHIRHKNHGIHFWRELETILPGAKKIDKELNNYHLTYW